MAVQEKAYGHTANVSSDNGIADRIIVEGVDAYVKANVSCLNNADCCGFDPAER